MRLRSLIVLSFFAVFGLISGCGTGTTRPAAPAFTPNGGTFTAATAVNISMQPNAGTIHYTLDGSVPTAASPTYGGSFLVSTTTTVRALVVSSFGELSDVASATFTINLPIVATPVITPPTGTYTGTQYVTISDAQAGAYIYYTLDGSTPTSTSARFGGQIAIPASATVKAIAMLNGYVNSAVASSVLTITQSKVATPAISPSGGTYTSAQTVSITSTTSGATIYYTLDGSTPAPTSSKYTSALRIANSTTVKAIAIASAYQPSDVASAIFTINAGASVAARVSVGGKAVSGATVQLLSAGASGLGSVPAVRGTGTALSDTSGNVSVPFVCGSAADQVYLISRGGTPASRAAGAIPGLVLVTALGRCDGLGTSYTVNENTTVAAAYALAPFVDATAPAGSVRVGATSTNATGIANAFLTTKVLADPVTGALGGPSLAGSSTLPTAELKTLASIVASCGALTGANPCGALLSAATISGRSAPSDSFEAMANVASRPGNNVANLFSLAVPGAGLSVAPADWTLAIRHTGGGIAKPTAIGLDAGGNAWVSSYDGALAKLSPQGAPISPANGYTGGGLKELLGLAIDPSGNVWVTSSESSGSVNSGFGAVQKFSNSGVLLSGATGFGGAAVYFPEAATADSNGNIWVANYGNSSVALLNNAGTALTAAGGLGSNSGRFAFPLAVATDASNGAWFSNQGGSTITRVAADRTIGTPITCCNAPSGIALGATGVVWATNYYGNSVSEIAANGAVLNAGITGGGLAQPQGIAVDGAGNIWVANYRMNTLSEFQGESQTSPGTPDSGSNGFGAAAGLSLPTRIAVDSSGSLWVASYGNDAVLEFVGLASPVKTPLIGLPVQP